MRPSTLRPTGPAPAAASPFRIKGIAYRGAFELYDRIVPGGMAAIIESAGSEQLRGFLMQPFLPSTWYDIMPFPEVDRVAAGLCGQPLASFVRETSRRQAREELGGLYRRLLKLVSPALVAQYLPRLAAQYYDFGTVETAGEPPGAVVVTRRKVPTLIADWLQITGLEYVAVALEMSGAEGVQVRALGRQPDGEQAGYSLSLLRGRIAWR